MKKYTLDETWRLCLKMWKWVAREWKKNEGQDVEHLKEEWLDKNGLGNECFRDDCFFCEYAVNQPRTKGYVCDNCPGRLISPKFSCTNHQCDYENHPDKFYAKLLELNKKRNAKK